MSGAPSTRRGVLLERLPIRPRTVSTSVGRVRVLEARGGGALPPLLMLHGFGAQALHYLPTMRRLRPHFASIHAPDLLGHGFSETPRAMDAEVLRTGLVETLREVQTEPAIVLGNSMGGLAALRFALERPELVRALILISPAGAMRDADGIDTLKQKFALRSHDDALRFIDRLFADRTRWRHLLALGVRRGFARPALRSLIEGVDEGSFLEPEALARLEMPILFVWGKKEKLLDPEDLGFFRRHLPAHAEVLEPDGFGHSPFLEDPAGVAAMTLRFAQSLPGRARAG
jgi:pimeloyl-ACP methyl ester carboxylesterase